MSSDAAPKINVIGPKSGVKWSWPKMNPVMVVIATVILAIVSVLSAVLLYRRGIAPVAPNIGAPSRAASGSSCTVEFNLTVSATPTPTPVPGATPTPTPTPAQGEPNHCGGTCGSNANCIAGLFCYDTGVQKYCRNPQNPTSVVCAGLTPTPTPTVTRRPAPTPTPVVLKEAGEAVGTWTISIVGILMLGLGSLLMLAL